MPTPEDTRILHVDDEPAFAELTADMLERESDRVTIETATTASEGLDRLSDREYDCIVSDYEMPDMNGIEFLERVREEHGNVPFVLFTGKGSEEIASDAISAGVTDYLQKEPGSDQYTVLANRIANAVEQYRAKQRLRERERELERQNRRLAALFENFPEPTFGYVHEDGEPHVAFVNEAFTDVFGYDADEAVGEHVDDLIVPPDRREEARRIDDRVRAGETIDEVLRRQTPDGVRDFRFRNVRLPDDDAIDGYAIYTDVTERRERERELERERERVDAILEHTTTPIFMKDDEGRYIFTNRAYREVFDIDGEIAGQTAHDLFRPEVADPIEEYDRTVLETGEPIEFEGGENLEGEERTFLTTIVPIYDTVERTETEDPVAIFGVASDITDLKRRERELERERDRLDEFASIVSHDLRSPLNVASARLELASEECDSDHLDDVAGALDRMRTLIDDLRTLAREGEPATDRQPVALADLAEACWGTVRTESASLVVDTDVTVRAARSRLQQLLENLIHNAVEHGSTSPDSGSDGAVEHGGTDLTVTVGDLDGGFYVADDGPGVPADDRHEVFDAGYSTAEDGTGFGLAIVEEIAEAHGWDVRVTEGESGGARFEITGVEVVD